MKILVTVPTTGYIHKHCVFALLELNKDPRVQVMLPTHNPFENNLHHIIKDFREGGYDWWLSFDADNPPFENPLEAIEYDKDIVGFPTPIVHIDKNAKKGERPVYWNAYKKVEGGYTEWPDKYGLQKVDAIGTGCFLINKRVFEHPDMQKGAFTRKLYPDGRVEKGNDISFCERATEAGFEIYADYTKPCRHFKEIELNELVGAFKNLYE